MRLSAFRAVFKALGPATTIIVVIVLLLAIGTCMQYFLDRELLKTLFYGLLYMIASPVAILLNKILMKDIGFGYPVLVSALGQLTTAIAAYVAVRLGYVNTETGRLVDNRSLIVLGGCSALALVLGQYPYLYLTVAFIQMLKAFSPAYMVVFLVCLRVEYPSKRVVACVLGLSLFTAVASAGEVNFNLIGVTFMMAASCSDAIRLVIAQKLLKNLKMQPVETLYFITPICLVWMIPAACITEIPAALRAHSFKLIVQHPLTFLAAGLAGCFVNLTSFLLVRRTSSMSLKTLTMARNGGLVVAAAVFMSEPISALEAFGYTGLLVCFAIYTYVKAQESSLSKNSSDSKAASDAEKAVEMRMADGEASASRELTRPLSDLSSPDCRECLMTRAGCDTIR